MSVTRLRVLPESEEDCVCYPGYECYRRVREIVSVTQVTSVTGE